MAHRLFTLRDELENDVEGRGYKSMRSKAVADQMNTVDRTMPNPDEDVGGTVPASRGQERGMGHVSEQDIRDVRHSLDFDLTQQALIVECQTFGSDRGYISMNPTQIAADLNQHIADEPQRIADLWARRKAAAIAAGRNPDLVPEPKMSRFVKSRTGDVLPAEVTAVRRFGRF